MSSLNHSYGAFDISVSCENLVELKRTCKGICKEFRAKKPAAGGRYEAGQGRCQTCDIWLDHSGGHMADGTPAKNDSVGWVCNCCNFRIRQSPRRRLHKERFRAKKADRTAGN